MKIFRPEMNLNDYRSQFLQRSLVTGSFTGAVMMCALIARDFSFTENQISILLIDFTVLAIFLVAGFISRFAALGARLMHALTFLLVISMTAKSSTTLIISGDAAYASQPLLVLAISSAVYLSHYWFFATCLTIAIAWYVVATPFLQTGATIVILIAMALVGLLGSVFIRWRNADLHSRFNLEREVRVLRGMVPICASCKKIRDKQGSWNHLESYLETHSEAQFTHGSCPDCSARLLSELNY